MAWTSTATVRKGPLPYTEHVVQRYGIKGCNLAYASGVRPELSLNQPEMKMLEEEEKWRYQAITGAVIYVARVTRYDILCAVNQLARAMSKSAKAHMGAAKHRLAIWLRPSRAPSGLLPSRMSTKKKLRQR